MNYIESVASTAALSVLKAPASKEVVAHALSLRDSVEVLEASSAASHALELETLSPEDQSLFQTRIFGGLATKLALTSYYSEAPNLSTLSIDDQKQELEELANRYAANTIDDPQVLLGAISRQDALAHVPNSLVRSWVYDTRRAQVGLTGRLKAIRSYIDVRPGTFPPEPYYIKPVGDNDVTLVQAFGRDSITDEELITIRDKQKELGSGDAMMEYLDTVHFQPGPSNTALATVVVEQLQSSAPIEQILQWEVSYAVYEQYPDVYAKYKNYIHTLWPHSEFYPTYEVKQDSVAVMDKIGLYNAQELAHPDMMARAVGILEKLGVQPDPVAADIPYDPESTQPHVRSTAVFLGREVLARSEHFLRGRVSF